MSVSLEVLNEPTEGDEWYDFFIKRLLTRVEVIDDEEDVVVAWSDMIRTNIETFRGWTLENWYKGNYEDEESYIYEWLKEIHLMIAGYGSENTYERLCRLLNKVPMV